MLGTTYINLISFFYPLGNTPAVNLLQHRFRPASKGTEQESVNVLLLACGDPRNLLFSLWCESMNDEPFNCEFTCCDIEPAVLARNIVLFSLIVRNVSITSTWNIFYHFYIPESDMALLKEQAEELIHHSLTSEGWSSSIYGRMISFLSQDTLQQLRKFWLKYAKAAALDGVKRKEFEEPTREGIRNIMKKRFPEGVSYVPGRRSAGVHWARASQVLSSSFRKFWETGVAAGNTQDVQGLGPGGRGCVNPMFAFSSSASADNFSVHYGTEPLLGFHLASAFDDQNLSQQELKDKAVQLAKSQFQEWCEIFRRHSRSRTLRIRIFCGDALRFCYELLALHDPRYQGTNIVRAYTAPWRPTGLVLQDLSPSDGKSAFDVIDTSNLIDHVGILNILPAIAPLLSRRVTSVLYTDSLLEAAKDHTVTLSTLLCSDVNTMSLLVGLAPVGHLLGHTADEVGIEAIAEAVILQTWRQRQYYLRIPWKISYFGDRSEVTALEDIDHQVEFHPEQLAGYFFKLYLTMFNREDMSSLMSTMMRHVKSLIVVGLQHYNRMSFVMLLQFAKCHIQTDWNSFFSLLMDKIESDRRLLVNSNNIQELYLLLHLLGLYSTKALNGSPRHIGLTPYGQIRPPSADTGLLGRTQIPSVVFVALVVPRKSLEVFTKQDRKTLGTPGLHISVTNLYQGFDNSFYSIQCFFGSLSKRSDDDSVGDVIADERGWQGQADLIATCAVPAWSLLLGSRKGLSVSLTVNASPFTAHYLAKLGLRMNVFQCGLDDSNLSILGAPPRVQFQSGNIYERQEQSSLLASKSLCLINLDGNFCATTMEMRKRCTTRSAGPRVTSTHVSPCTMVVTIEGSEAIEFRYPYPIDGSRRNVKTTPEGFVELIVPVAPALVSGGYDLNPFPMCLRGNQALSLCLPGINLDQQKVVPLTGDFGWVSPFMGWALSDRERKLYNQELKETSDGLFELKKSLNCIFQSFVGTNQGYGQQRMFQLICKHKNDSCDTLIFASALCHNIAQNSIVLDAYVVPLTKKRVTEIISPLVHLVESGRILSIVVSSRAEEVLWKQLLPSLAECCRKDWHHSEKCEYRTQGHIPLCTAHSESPICSCGQEKATKGFPKFENWQKFAKYATRVAIMPLSAVPYVESLASEDLKRQISQIETNLTSMADSVRCGSCGKVSGQLKKCARCQKVSYCNHDCQKAAWKTHKKDCRKA